MLRRSFSPAAAFSTTKAGPGVVEEEVGRRSVDELEVVGGGCGEG